LTALAFEAAAAEWENAVPELQWDTPGDLARAVDPTTVQTPALDLIDEALVWAYRTRGARLIISIAPQEGKTTRAVQIGSLWALTDDPERRIGVVSYQKALAENSGRIVRNLITSFDGTDGALDLGLRIAPDNGAASRWQLDGHRGGMICAGIGSGLTGKPLEALVIDDPFADMVQAESEVFRERAWSWWTSVGSTRLAPGAPVIQIATRWHEKDLAGKLIAAEDGHRWRVINIPALADHKPENGEADPLGRQPGEWLKSARGRTDAEWEQIRIQAGSRVFTALYQGRPSPDAGNVWKRQWWRKYDSPLWSQHPTVAGAWLVDADEVLISVDCAFKDTKSSDFVVMQVWARRGAMAYLVDQVRKRLSFTDTITALVALVAKWPQAMRKLIEDKANGTAVIDSLKSKVPGLVPVNPTDSKYGRATAVAPVIEAGNALLPEAGIGLFDPEELITEASSFPNGSHDDQVDATSQALAEMFLDGTGAQAWLNWAKRKAEEAAAARGETPGAVPVADAAPGQDEAAVSPGTEPDSWRVRSSDGQRDYVIGPDGRCPCPAGIHGRQCRHVAEAVAAGAKFEVPLSPAEIRKRARDAAFRAQYR
jgi:predicted phage terminase large subunit-like protein